MSKVRSQFKQSRSKFGGSRIKGSQIRNSGIKKSSLNNTLIRKGSRIHSKIQFDGSELAKINAQDENDLMASLLGKEDDKKIIEDFEDESIPLGKKKIENIKDNANQVKKLFSLFEKGSKKKYSENPNIHLLILCLKKSIKSYTAKNKTLKLMNEELKKKDQENFIKLKDLTEKVEDLEIEKKLLNEKPSEQVRYDIDELDSRLISMNNNLNKATVDNSQEHFLKEITDKNNEYIKKTRLNGSKMKKFKDDLDQLKGTLINLNGKSFDYQ